MSLIKTLLYVASLTVIKLGAAPAVAGVAIPEPEQQPGAGEQVPPLASVPGVETAEQKTARRFADAFASETKANQGSTQQSRLATIMGIFKDTNQNTVKESLKATKRDEAKKGNYGLTINALIADGMDYQTAIVRRSQIRGMYDAWMTGWKPAQDAGWKAAVSDSVVYREKRQETVAEATKETQLSMLTGEYLRSHPEVTGGEAVKAAEQKFADLTQGDTFKRKNANDIALRMVKRDPKQAYYVALELAALFGLPGITRDQANTDVIIHTTADGKVTDLTNAVSGATVQ